MIGTFLESLDNKHISERERLLCGTSLPEVQPCRQWEAELGDDDMEHVKERLRVQGVCLVQLREPLTPERFELLANILGDPMFEGDPSVQNHVDRGVLLNLRATFGPTRNVSLQPFSSDFLTLHTESSGHPLDAQPRLIVLHCLDEGEEESQQHTVVVPMDSVARQIGPEMLEVLHHTRYDNGRHPPSMARVEDGRDVFSFRDFYSQGLAWVHDGKYSELEVNAAIVALLDAMYRSPDACAVRWRRGMLLAIDNQRVFHGRTRGVPAVRARPRHLLRARLLPHDPLRVAVHATLPPECALPGLFEQPRELERLAQIERREPVPMPADVAAFCLDDRFIDESTCDLFARAQNPDDPQELLSLWLGRVEARLGAAGLRPELAQRWQSSRVRRNVRQDDVLDSGATVGLVKLLFNTFFRDELYGCFEAQRQVVLSSGTVDEQILGLPQVLKDTVRYALDRDWYGYSDSRGREATRLAIAALESARVERGNYSAANVVVGMGATQTIAALADFLLHGRAAGEPVLCGIPNYPPLVAAIARRHPVRLVPTPSVSGITTLDRLCASVRPGTPLVLLQTGTNPCGSLVDEQQISCFIEALPASTLVILDECHEWLGAGRLRSAARSRANVIRVSSLSKEWSAPGMKVGWFLAEPALVSDFYEYASSNYGGPPSLMYSLVEVLARLELWHREGRTSVGASELAQFASDFRLSGGGLAAAYTAYTAARRAREAALLQRREWCWQTLRSAGFAVRPARCSINLLAAAPDVDDSYLAFRSILRQTGVSIYPGVLNFYLAGGAFRLTTSRSWPALDEGMGRLRYWLAQRRGGGSDAEEGR